MLLLLLQLSIHFFFMLADIFLSACRQCIMNSQPPTYRLTKISVQSFQDMVVLDIFPKKRFQAVHP